MNKIRTKIEINCATYLDGCAVKGYFLEKYAAIRDLSIEIKALPCSVSIEACDIFDRTTDFERTREWLAANGKCVLKIPAKNTSQAFKEYSDEN